MQRAVSPTLGFCLTLGLCLGGAACDRPASVVPPAGSTVAMTASAVASPSSEPPAAPAASTDASPVASEAPSAAPSAAAPDPLATPALFADDGTPLDQTEDRPSVDSPAFKRRVELVWQAIVEDDPTIAEPAFFPKVAYEKVKDIKSPGADWKNRLMKNFARDVRRYHDKLGDDAKAARFVGLEVDEPRVKWMDRGKEGNKLGYFRVTRSKLRYVDPAGKERTLELTSLISWRGEWFVVHLNGFK